MILAGMLICMLGIMTYIIGRVRRGRLWKITSTPRSKTATAPQGLVELNGFAWPYEKTIQSLQGHECVFYYLALEKLLPRGKYGEWVVIDKVELRSPFLIVDTAGLTLIDATQSTQELANRRVVRWFFLNRSDRTKALELFGDRRIEGFPATGISGFIHGPRFRFDERMIVIGSPLHVVGDFRTDRAGRIPFSSPGLTAFTRKVFQKGTRDFKQVYEKLDQDRDGTVTEVEARQGYQKAARAARVEARFDLEAEEQFEIHGRMTSSQHHELQLADAHEEQLIRRMKSSSLKTSMISLLLLTIGAAILMHHEKERREDERKWGRARAVESLSVNSVPAFHSRCLNSDAFACRELLNNAEDLALSSHYIRLYEQALQKAEGANP